MRVSLIVLSPACGATTQKITGQCNMKTLNSPTDDQETTHTTVEAVDATLQYLSQTLLPRCRFQNQEYPELQCQ
jgi:hypothetical protein